MNKKLIAIIEEIAEEKISKLSLVKDLEELDFWDSIARVQLIVSVEQEIGRSLDDNELNVISSTDLLNKLIN
jgi:acyl carrier protein